MIDILHLNLSERQRGLVAVARDLASRFAPRAAEHDRSATFPFANLVDLRAAGYQALTVPASYGGRGATLFETVLCQEQLAQGDGPTALVLAMPLHLIGGIAESSAWPGPAFERLCREIVDRGALINSAASEREMGSPSRGGLFATVAQEVEGGWRISGRKIYTSGAPALTHALVGATLAGTSATGVFLVPMDAPGVSVDPTWNGSGMRAARNDDLVLANVLVDAADLLVRREPGAPDATGGSAGAWFQLTIGALYLGIAQAARTAALDYARDRRPTALDGQAISTLEPIRRQFGTLEATLLSARALLYQVAQTWDSHPAERASLKALVGLAKATAATSAVAAVDQAMLIVGGAALTSDLALERLSRDVRAGLFHPPTLDAALIGLGTVLVEG
ncbi:MAG: acyl-CoA/acyl-ACP dehydrogenase [Herpetosiphonaceae bacterium]|nr:acyl-CoA/acyl-ACP dehydrogenase [Herpetosiphonaceae bacterium]